MAARIIDGRSRFGCSLVEFYRQDALAVQIARRGILVPPVSAVDRDADPALAYVNPLPDGSVRWIANCPTCLSHGRTVAQYVWLDQPLLFCTRCANASIGGCWRPIAVPSERAEIERLLLLRTDPEQRAWTPSETVADLVEQNTELGVN